MASAETPSHESELPPLRFFTHSINKTDQANPIHRAWGKAEATSRQEEGNALYRFYDLVNLYDGTLDTKQSALLIQWLTERAQADHSGSRGHTMYSSTKQFVARTDFTGKPVNLDDTALHPEDNCVLSFEIPKLDVARTAFRDSLWRTMQSPQKTLYQASVEQGADPPYNNASLIVHNTVRTLREWLRNFDALPGNLKSAHLLKEVRK